NAPLIMAYEHITTAFPGGPDPATVVLKAKDIKAPAVTSAVASFTSSLRADPEFGQPVRTRVYAGPDVAIIDVPLAGDGSDATSRHALATLRAKVPPAFDRVAEAHVSGTLAFSEDWNEQLRGSIVPVFAFVLVVTFLLMLFFFRSLPIAATAIVL